MATQMQKIANNSTTIAPSEKPIKSIGYVIIKA